jgi:hypothetical protein
MSQTSQMVDDEEIGGRNPHEEAARTHAALQDPPRKIVDLVAAELPAGPEAFLDGLQRNQIDPARGKQRLIIEPLEGVFRAGGDEAFGRERRGLGSLRQNVQFSTARH